MSAVGAGLDVTAERCGAAVLDRRHHLELVQAQMPGMGGPVGRACSVEDIRDLERGAHAASAVGPCLRPGEHRQLVERADDGAHGARRDFGVERSVLELGVAERTRAIVLISLCH